MLLSAAVDLVLLESLLRHKDGFAGVTEMKKHECNSLLNKEDAFSFLVKAPLSKLRLQGTN